MVITAYSWNFFVAVALAFESAEQLLKPVYVELFHRTHHDVESFGAPPTFRYAREYSCPGSCYCF